MTSKLERGARFLSWLEQAFALRFIGAVLSGADERGERARASATDFLAVAAGRTIEIMNFRTASSRSKAIRSRSGLKH